MKFERLEPVLHNKRSRCSEKPVHYNGEQPLLAATRESLSVAANTQHGQKKQPLSVLLDNHRKGCGLWASYSASLTSSHPIHEHHSPNLLTGDNSPAILIKLLRGVGKSAQAKLTAYRKLIHGTSHCRAEETSPKRVSGT